MSMTDYSVGYEIGLAGEIATNIKTQDIRSKVNAANTVLAYGRAVVQGTNADEVILPAANKTDFVGIVARTYVYEDAMTADGAYGYPAKKQVDILTAGEIIVETEQAVAPGDKVFFRIAASPQVGGPAIVGKFRKDGDINTTPDPDVATAIEIPNARWISTVTSATGGLARLMLK